MKTKVTILLSSLLIAACLMAGCADKKEMGDISNEEFEMYYIKTEVLDRTYHVVEDNKTANGHHVRLESDGAGDTFLESEPGTVLMLDLTNEEYKDAIDGYSMVSGSFTVYTTIDPQTGGVLTTISNEDKETVLRNAHKSKDYYMTVSKKELGEYVARWKLLHMTL